MNGVLLKGNSSSSPLFITNGTHRKHGHFKDEFERAFRASDLGIKILFLDETAEIMHKMGGGIHCLTWEKP